ncbi:single-stranded-DNA-specific exonuclease RecJ [Saccharospirillum salsuginis]|uniref:Single-stranded-DNA-specific exonuclease RecJ n=1 Tax=Saccharospirillum salsuginis TaxID=418750 RepID=A0A918KJB9_9GAMM|nr:single-stranded-DNA-specific exonuclease RecJ [Saccharospirillum salsuginis]GGX64739.1 single-stranded-DNA-specific exonuclease RecJ [Saccharospirillum salsuginis]
MTRPLPEIITRPVAGDAPLHDHPLLDRLYRARGVRQAGDLDTGLASLTPWQSLKGIQASVALLETALKTGQRVLIVGDYDADGATSTALTYLALRSLGMDVRFLLPNRFEYGYGLSPEIVSLALEQSPDLIITVDNGIASIDGVRAAREAGVAVLVTDHHLPADELPEADAIVNPNQPGCDFPSKAACGCTVVFYLLIALRASLREQGWFQHQGIPELNLGQWLDLVALATVADVVPLDANNRRLVQQGLLRIRNGQARPGVLALFEAAGRDWQRAQSQDFGFAVGPRLNAAGRLDDMTLGVRCLITDDPIEARALATQLEDLNRERRAIERSMVVDAERHLTDLEGLDNRLGHVLFQPDWHEGVIGILASRIKDKTYRPVIALAESDKGLLKGSARSIPGFHLRDGLDWIAGQAPGLLRKFGGHAMAAGLSIEQGREGELQTWFEKAVETLCEPEALVPQLVTDGTLGASDLTLTNALALEQAGPWGQGFPVPSFHGEWRIESQRIVGERHLKLQLVDEQGVVIDGIAFNIDVSEWPTDKSRLRGVYQLSCNRYRGRETLQLIFEAIEAI